MTSDVLSVNLPQSSTWNSAHAVVPESLAQPAPATPPMFLQGIAGVVQRWWQARVQPARHLRLVESLALGPKRSVALLELDGQRFLAGMGADGVTTLLQVNAPVGKADQP